MKMICAIYRSIKRDQTYLYIEKKDDFSRIPEELLQSFGEPQFAMSLSLAQRERLANADIEKVKQALNEQGFYLQVPPPVESMLNAYLDELKKSEKTE
ncbi:YcgL family protein [Proteus myxofaciens ATCC 19692]|uniref:YcgL domain-containing protein M983_0149 n=2 Tax=Proteus myxofaciens TaxID=184072 RepID=A0A198GPV4_9GAMM|nr:YcgL family protein [Proteus myxofaciens ATCC 19692]